MSRASRLVAGAFVAWTWACAVSAPIPGSPPSPDRDIVVLRAQKCGSCHALPEPKSHTRADLEGASLRHKNRVRLTPSQWARLIDYLAKRSPYEGDASVLTQPLPFR
jgi:hypothetical protein